MSKFYDRVFRIKKWVITSNDLTEKQIEVLQKHLPKSVVKKEWPSSLMKEELQFWSTQGYHEHVNQKLPFHLDMTLALRAMISITRKLNVTAQISSRPQYHHSCNNRLTTENCYKRLGDEILFANDEITLSQVFGTADCADQVWFSWNADPRVCRSLCNSLITVGNGQKYDIDLTDLNQKDMIAAFVSGFKD